MMDAIEDEAESGPAPLLASTDPDLESEPDDGLVTYMALQAEDPDLAMRACCELHRRHAGFLMGWCFNNRAETFGNSAESYVNQAFMRAYERAHQFTCPAELDPEQKRRRVIAWLFRILKNLFFDSRKAEMRGPFLRSDDDEDGLKLEASEPDPTPTASVVSPERKNLILKFIQSCEPVDQAILKATAECWSPTAGKTVMRSDVRERICEEFGLTENSLRVRRSRALERAKKYILENEKPEHKPNEKAHQQRK